MPGAVSPAALRRLGLCLSLLAGAGFFALRMHVQQPVQHWLVWRYLLYWLVTLGWGSCCLALGCWLSRQLLSRAVPLVERTTLSFALGVFAFSLAVFVLGLLHALHTLTFFLLPLACFWLGFRDLQRTIGQLRRVPLTPRSWPGMSTLALAAFGLLAIGLLYFQILSPEGFSFDVRWYHIPLAQRYALSGAIGPSPEGFWMAAYPQLCSYLYTWAFLIPRSLLFDRLELCAHLEFLLFLATLAQIPVLVRRLVPRLDVRLSWVVLLLFPGIYLYDSNLHAGADHVAGFWAIPIALCGLGAWRRFHTRNALSCAVFLSAAALTKYTALTLVVPAALALTARACWLRWARGERQVSRAFWLLVASALVLTAPHWLKNWLWYGDPAYPALHGVLSLHPWGEDAASRFGYLQDMNRVVPLTWQGLLDALGVMFSFSFVPHDWAQLHGDVPVFGSLFTLTLFCVPFLKEGRRLLWLYTGAMAAVFVWCFLNRFDRYLQTILPWMAAATAACLWRVWQEGQAVRLALLPLIGLQIGWGGDVPFIRSHNLVGDSPVRQVADFLQSGYAQKEHRLRVYEPLNSIGKAFPADAVVLAHDIITILGIDRNWVTDLHQSQISYGRLLTPRAIHRQLAQLGVSHLLWPNWSIGRDSLAGDLAFLNYVVHHTVDQQTFGPHTVARLPDAGPADAEGELQVVLFGCNTPYASGLYGLSQLTLPVRKPGPAPKAQAPVPGDLGAFSGAFVVVDRSCHKQRKVAEQFALTSTRGTLELYLRR